MRNANTLFLIVSCVAMVVVVMLQVLDYLRYV